MAAQDTTKSRVCHFGRDHDHQGVFVKSVRWALPAVVSTLAVLLSPATAVSASEPDPSDIVYTATYTPLEDLALPRTVPLPHRLP
ncbi:hypothetical protein [Streptomyces mirabilis]|uniref:hypothetical protein n=1 Tax=Streptomyces mirabilis TaxID=68239 RepID=UPI0033204D0C